MVRLATTAGRALHPGWAISSSPLCQRLCCRRGSCPQAKNWYHLGDAATCGGKNYLTCRTWRGCSAPTSDLRASASLYACAHDVTGPRCEQVNELNSYPLRPSYDVAHPYPLCHPTAHSHPSDSACVRSVSAAISMYFYLPPPPFPPCSQEPRGQHTDRGIVVRRLDRV